MSQENIEIAMRAIAAFNSGNVDEALEFFSPDAELRDLANAPDQASVVKGIDAIREAWTLWAAAFDESHPGIAVEVADVDAVRRVCARNGVQAIRITARQAGGGPH
jgi:ketosteroid isomerase-like protein